MRIQTVPCLTDNLSYLVIDDSTRTCVVVDPSEASPFLDTIKAQDLDLRAIMTTHHHYDHIGGLPFFPRVPVWSSKRDLARVPGAGGGHSDRFDFDDGTHLDWSEITRDPSLANVTITFEALAIPGHTEGQTALIFTAANSETPHVFVGDTLFSLGCGRCMEGTPEQLFGSLQRIKSLPGQSRLYFGHEYTERNALFWISHATAKDSRSSIIELEKIQQALLVHAKLSLPKAAPTLREEMNLNPFLKMQNASDFIRWRELRDQF